MKKFMEDPNLTLIRYLAQGQFPVNFQKYTEPGNPKEININRVLYYENLMEQLAQIFQELGIPFKGSLGVNAKSEYRKDRRPYAEIYASNQVTLIDEIFGHEISLHGYKF
jgi:hypothetical protein